MDTEDERLGQREGKEKEGERDQRGKRIVQEERGAMLLYLDTCYNKTLLQPRRRPSEPTGAGWNQIVITWASGGWHGNASMPSSGRTAKDAATYSEIELLKEGKGTGRLTLWGLLVSELAGWDSSLPPAPRSTV